MNFSNRNIFLLIVLTVGVSMTRLSCICTELEIPIWEAPCGIQVENGDLHVDKSAINPNYKRRLIMRSLKEIKQTLRFCIYFYQRHNFTKKNEGLVQNSLTIFQDGWLPTSEEVRLIKIKQVGEIPKVELIMYSMLQKYAMMFAEIANNDYEKKKQKYAKKIMQDLKLLLCEVHSTLISLEEKPIDSPGKIPQRYLFTQYTEMHFRDTEVISKYGKFLREWRQWIRNTRNQLRKNRKRNRQNSGH